MVRDATCPAGAHAKGSKGMQRPEQQAIAVATPDI
jgi:hypothetical protein